VRKMSQTQTLTVDPKYLESIPRPSKERYNEIKIDIKQHVQQIAIITNQDNVILDGHTRFQICQELNIIPKTEKRTFTDKLQEERFVYSTNVKRRDLEEFVHIELSLKIHEIDDILGKQKRTSNLIQYKDRVGTEKQNSANRENIDTRKEIARETKTSTDTVSRTKKILKQANKEDIQKLREGKVSINKVYKKIKKQEKKKKRQDEIKKIQVNLPKTIQLHNKPFQELNIKDNSISLIFTDPPYTKEFLHLYDEMAKQAARVLRDGGSLMCYIGHYALDVIIPMIKKHGLTYHHPIAVIHSGLSSKMDYKKVLVGYKLMLWFTKGRYDGDYVKDVIKSEFQGKELHEWAQSTVESDYYIKHTTIPNDIVYDPFMGQGTFGISARKLDRQFIGAEINEGHFKNAQRLISAKHSEIKTKKQDRKKYNDDYKNINRKQLNKKEAQRMKEKREFIKKIKPLFELEKHPSESFTEFYNRKRKEIGGVKI
jgi:site-specific DNA-methyltransferase (adenine-specific)